MINKAQAFLRRNKWNKLKNLPVQARIVYPLRWRAFILDD